MECPACGHENREDARFCGECRAPLEREIACSACGRRNPIGQRFCDGCAEPLQSVETPRPADTSTAPPRESPQPAPTSFAAGRYHVRRFLGEGAKKRVYLARDTRLDRDVAIGVIKREGLDEQGRSRVDHEARAMGRLGEHPHIVNIYDVDEDGGQLFVVSQYVASGNLEQRLREAPDRRLPLADALRVADELSQALEHAHARGVVHRDIKPANVYLAEDGAARLGDFGLAASLDRTRLTQEGK